MPVSKPTETANARERPVEAAGGVGTDRALQGATVQWPATGDELRDAGYRPSTPRSRGICRSCEGPIVWALTPAGRKMPLEELPEIEGQPPRFRPHFASCLAAEFHRRRNKSLRRST